MTSQHDRIESPYLALLLSSCLALACASGCKPGEGEGKAAPAGERTLVVFAAASLRDAFEALGEGFRRTHDHARVTFNFAGSQELRTQIEHGAAADVFASADRAHMAALARQGLVGQDVIFAHNELVVVVPAGDRKMGTFQELPAAERLVIGAPDVPVGRYTGQVLGKAAARWPGFEQRVMARVVSRELNVRQVLAKVVLGEADAGIVYRTDAAAAAGEVDIIPIPADLNVVAEYPIAVLARSSHSTGHPTGDPALAADWIAYVRSPAGQQVLARAGFVPVLPGAAPVTSPAADGQP